MKQKTILLSALDNYGAHPFDEIVDVIFPAYKAKDVEAVNGVCKETNSRAILVIWGGADISPSIYHQKPNSYCAATEKLSSRDELEVEIAQAAITFDIPIIGICRGAQLMCALSGGSLVQHVEGHAEGWHEILTKDGERYNCPSLHHQMMWPWGAEHEMVAWMERPRSRRYCGEPTDDPTLGKDAYKLLELPGPEPEIVWFPKTKSLCIQSHPEFISDVKHPFVQYTFKLTNDYILGKV